MRRWEQVIARAKSIMTQQVCFGPTKSGPRKTLHTFRTVCVWYAYTKMLYFLYFVFFVFTNGLFVHLLAWTQKQNAVEKGCARVWRCQEQPRAVAACCQLSHADPTTRSIHWSLFAWAPCPSLAKWELKKQSPWHHPMQALTRGVTYTGSQRPWESVGTWKQGRSLWGWTVDKFSTIRNCVEGRTGRGGLGGKDTTE